MIRDKLCKAATVVPKSVRVRSKATELPHGQRKLSFSIPEDEPEDTYVEGQGFLRFSAGEGGEMDEYLKYLMDIDGGKKSAKEARECAVDVSKYLRYCSSSHSWDHLLQDPCLLEACWREGLWTWRAMYKV